MCYEEMGEQRSVTMGTGKYQLPTFRSSSYTTVHSQLFISPQANPFCVFLRPSFLTSPPRPSFWHIKALHLSASFSILFLTRPPSYSLSTCLYFLSSIFSPLHLFFPTHSFFYIIIPVSLPSYPHPSSLSPPLLLSLILAVCSKSFSCIKKKNSFISSGVICTSALGLQY